MLHYENFTQQINSPDSLKLAGDYHVVRLGEKVRYVHITEKPYCLRAASISDGSEAKKKDGVLQKRTRVAHLITNRFF